MFNPDTDNPKALDALAKGLADLKADTSTNEFYQRSQLWIDAAHHLLEVNEDDFEVQADVAELVMQWSALHVTPQTVEVGSPGESASIEVQHEFQPVD